MTGTETNNEKRVLIVEDSFEIQILLSRLLRRAGYLVDCANDGRAALDKLSSDATAPGLILLDLMMPNIDGFEFRKRQGADARIAGIPVVLMTADSDVQGKATQIGAQGFLKKPFADPETIIATVARFF